MDASLVIDWSREAVRMAFVLAGPALAAALVVGLVVGAVQTMTQMHEPIVGQVARLAAVLVVLLMIVPWLAGCWVAYAQALIGSVADRF